VVGQPDNGERRDAGDEAAAMTEGHRAGHPGEGSLRTRASRGSRHKMARTTMKTKK
jgi:hypothetical protein